MTSRVVGIAEIIRFIQFEIYLSGRTSVLSSNLIVDHWSQLDGSVHPLDAPVFATNPHSFNLDYPPPAFIGDINNAPVVLLEANGGFDPVVTPSEFAAPDALDRYLDLLRNPRAVHPGQIAPYYCARNYADLIAAGEMVLVNAVAYRSVSISREPNNRRLAEQLPSTAIHRAWLRDVLVPAASRGERLVVAHRTALWRIKRSEPDLNGVIFTTNPVSADMSRATLAEIRAFLDGRRPAASAN